MSEDRKRRGFDLAARTDEELIALVAGRERDAFATLYDRYAAAAYGLALRMVGPSLAEEIVQDAFVRVWEHAATFDAGRAKFSTWLLTLVRYRAIDELRRMANRPVADSELIAALDVVAKEPLPDEEAERNDELRRLAAVLSRMPEEQRIAISYAYFGGYSQSEIATKLGWPLGTVKKRIRLGLQKLRAALRPATIGEEQR